MSASRATKHAQDTAEVRRILWVILVLNALVAAAKLVTGLLTGAVAMIADGFHSSMDASSNVVGLVGLKLAAQPPDEDHPYGHRRFETLATLAIGGLLLVAAWEIIQTMIDRILNGGSPDVTPISFGVMIGTMILNLLVTVYERRKGKALGSEILLADASHTASDFYVSLSVIVSLIVTSLGYPGIDLVVAVLIVGVIGRVGFSIIGRTSNILADHQMLDPGAVRAVLEGVPGLENTVRVRSRGPADGVHVDIDAQIKPATTTDHAYAIAKEIRERVRSTYPEVEEVQVHFAPQRDHALDYTLEARAAADAMGLSVHEVVPIPVRGGIALEMHVEVQPGLTLGEAHRQVSEFEARLKSRIASVREIVTHIEPANEQGAPLMHTQAALDLRDQALAVARRLYPDASWHNPTVRLALGGYALTMHCNLPSSVSVEEAHAIAEHVETTIRTELPPVQRITIHTEPSDAASAPPPPPNAAGADGRQPDDR